MFVCPVCGLPLGRLDRALHCPKGHSFDLASQGYANLLLPNRKSSKDPGDNADMVGARTRFLDSGHYQPLSDALGRILSGLCGGRPRILDAGCGEGYYAARLFGAMRAGGRDPLLAGVDLSRRAVRHAARRLPEGRFAVASLFELPLADGSADLVYNIFSPICAGEFARVLAPGGRFVAVYPAARHLFGLKELLYDQPYENPEKTFELEGFAIQARERLTYRFTLEGRALIESLFMMTPYYYKTPAAGAARLSASERLDTEADFWLVTYRPGSAR